MNATGSFAIPDQVLLWAANVLIHATVLTAISLLIAWLFRKAAVTRYWSLCLGMLLVLGSPLISALIQSRGESLLTLTLPIEDIPIAEVMSPLPPVANAIPELERPIVLASAPQAEESSLLDPIIAPVETAPTPPLVVAETTASARSRSDWLRVMGTSFIAVWTFGSAILLIRMTIGWIRMARILSNAVSVENVNLQQAFERACTAVGCSRFRGPRFVVSDVVSGPIAAGLFGGTVVFPRRLVEQVDAAKLADVLVHEVAHVARHDQIVVLVQNLVAALYWPHPLVRILNRELAKAREEVCDNFVLAGTEAPAYSRTLLSLAELVQQPDAMPGSVGFFTDRWKLEHRVAGLLDTRRDRTTFLNKRDWVLVAANSAALAVLMCLATITMATAQVNDNHDTNEAVFDETPTTVSGIVSAPGDKDGAPIGDAKPQSRERTSTSVSGRVLNSNGQPVAAPLWVGGPGRSGQWLRSPMRVAWNRVGKSAADGHFEITIPQPENESATSKASVVRLAATADGLGFAWTDVAVGKTADEVTLRMVKDTPIRGRIVTLDGTPAANVELNVVAVTAPDSLPDSSEIISSALLSSGIYTNWPAWPGGSPLTKPVVTDSDGRFQLSGLGSERHVRLEALGDGLAATRLSIITRKKPSDSANGAIAVRTGLRESSYFAEFTHVAVPGRIVSGTVVDQTNGKPIPDVRIIAPTSWVSRRQPAVTDAAGKFVIRHVPKATEYKLELSPRGANHFRSELTVPDPAGSEPLDVKFTLASSINLRGRVVDEVSGEGVQAEIVYNPLFPNEAIETLGVEHVANSLSTVQADNEGNFEIPVLPGPGAVSAEVKGELYATVHLKEQDLRKIFPEGELEDKPNSLGQVEFLSTAGGGQSRGVMGLSGVHAVELLNLRQDGPANEITLSLRHSRMLQGEIVDEKGKPVSGATVIGLGPSSTSITPGPLETNQFSVTGLLPGNMRTLLFLQQDRSLGAIVDVKGDQSGLVKVELKPTGSISGSLVDSEGDPISNGYVTLRAERIKLLTALWEANVDDEGRFTVDNLPAGEAFRLHARIQGHRMELFVRGDIRANSGEHLNLGTFRLINKNQFKAVEMESKKKGGKS